MKNARLISALLASTLCLLQVSICAQPYPVNRHEDRRGAQGESRSEGERGAGPGHSFYRGDRLPMNYRGHQYVVDDWHGHGLRSPPRGYHWVQTGGDYVLVAIASGVIAELLLNR